MRNFQPEPRKAASIQERAGLALPAMQRTRAVLGNLLAGVAAEVPALRGAAKPTSGFRVPRGFESRRFVGAYHLVRTKTRAGIWIVPLVPWLADALATTRRSAPPSPFNLVWPRDDGAPHSAGFDRAQRYDIVDQAGVTVTLPSGETPARCFTRHGTRHPPFSWRTAVDERTI